MPPSLHLTAFPLRKKKPDPVYAVGLVSNGSRPVPRLMPGDPRFYGFQRAAPAGSGAAFFTAGFAGLTGGCRSQAVIHCSCRGFR